MARIKPLTGRDAPFLLKLINLAARRAFGRSVEPAGIMAHNPSFLLPYLLSTRFVSARSAVDPRIRTLAIELAAELNGCAWCIDFGRAAALKQGVPAAKLDSLAEYASNPLFGPAERAALALAESMTRDVHVPDDVWDQARHHFGARELVELVVAVAMEGFYNRVNSALAIESQGFCALPAAASRSHAHQELMV